jgi:hypothetical protein
MTNLAKPIIDKLGGEAISRRVGVKLRSVRFARTAGTFPASWYREISQMCADVGEPCPWDAFNWNTPLVSEPENAGSRDA